MTRRLYIVDDDGPVRQSLRLMLAARQFSATLFPSGEAFLDAAGALPRGCLLLDVRMPRVDGIEVQRRLAMRRAAFPIVMMTGHGDLATAIAALRGGALAFLEKPFTKAALLAALDLAFLKLEDPAGFERQLAQTKAEVEALAERDRELLAHLASGSGNDMIARAMQCAPAAVDVARARLLALLGVEHLHDAIRIAHAVGYGAVSRSHPTPP